MQCSYLEIYNERVRDLLATPEAIAAAAGSAPSSRNRDPNNLTIISQGTDDSAVPGLSQHAVSNSQEALNLLSNGFENRTTASTKMNSESSRSHSVFTVYLVFQPPGASQARQCKLHFVDLAGSESAKKTGAEGQTLMEGNNINRSLSCLSKMIKTLANNYASGRKEQFSVRESKLTFLLRKSFGQGNPLCLIANISPSSDNVMETSSTLAFARNARALPNVVAISKDAIDPYLSQQLQQQQQQKLLASQTQAAAAQATQQSEYEKLLDVFGGADGLRLQLQQFYNVSVMWKRQRQLQSRERVGGGSSSSSDHTSPSNMIHHLDEPT